MTAPDWQPANDAEAAMVHAMRTDDRREFFRVIATTDLFLPQVETDDDRTQTFLTMEVVGRTVLPVFTSVEGLSAFAGAYTVTSYEELHAKWPRPQWWLAVNPGLPIDACAPIEAVAAAANGAVDVPTVGEAILDAMTEEPNAAADLLDTDEALRRAGARGDAEGFIESLLDATVVVPTVRPVSDPEEILGEERLWRVTGTSEAPAIEVFTSGETFAQAYPEPGPHVVLPLVLLLTVWPAEHALSVNPRTPLAVGLSPEDVHALLLWSAEEDGD